MKRRSIALSLLLLALPTSTLAQHEPPPERPPLGFTWWNDVPALIQRGNEALRSSDLERAELEYRDAQLRNGQRPEAPFNLGLVEANAGRREEARRLFDRAGRLAPTDPQLQRDVSYNTAMTFLQDAFESAAQQGDREATIESAIKAIDAFDQALRYNPLDDDSLFGRRQAQHLIELAATPPPEDQQQDQQDPGEDSEAGDDQQQPQEPQNGNNEQEPNEGENPPEQQDGEQPDESNNQQPQQQQPQQSPSERSQELTREEAEALLNLLGDEERVQMRQQNRVRVAPPEKPW